MDRKKLYLCLLALLAMALVLGACAKATPTPAPTPVPLTPFPITPAPITPVVVVPATPAPAPAAKRKLVMVYGNEPFSLAFYDISAPEFAPRNMYEALVDLDSKTGQVVPKLATKWEQMEPTRWRFTLRQGVKFHSGAEFTSQDVVDSIKWLTDTKGVVLEYVPMTEGKAVDKYTVDIITPDPDPLFLREAFFFLIYPSAIAKDNRDLGNASANGTGPYKLMEWKRGDRMTFTIFEGYWGARPQITDVDIVFREEAGVRLAMLRTGEAQWVYGLIPEQAAQAPKAVRAPSNETWFLTPDTFIQKAELGRDSPFGDMRLRLALQHAIDRKALAQNIYSGFGTLAKAQSGKPGYFGYDPTLEDYPYDLAKAKALVQEAGAVGKTVTYVGSAGRWTKDKEFAEAITYMMEQSGLKVTLKLPEYKEYIDYLLTGGDRRKIMADLTSVASSLDTLIAAYTVGTWATSKGVGSKVSDSKLDGMFADYAAQSDLALREQKLKDTFRYIKEQAYLVFIISPDWIWGLSKNLDWTPGPDARPIFAEMRFTD